LVDSETGKKQQFAIKVMIFPQKYDNILITGDEMGNIRYWNVKKIIEYLYSEENK